MIVNILLFFLVEKKWKKWKINIFLTFWGQFFASWAKPNLLEKQWQPITQKLGKFSHKYNKKILFTEYGYMSVDGCAGKAWEIEKNKDNLAINQKAQANALHALLKVWSAQDFWAGGFLWKWFPDGLGHEGYPEKDYTPQDKEAEKILKSWFVKI